MLYSFCCGSLPSAPLHSLLTLINEKCTFPSGGGVRGHWDWALSMQPLLFHDSLNLFSLACNWTPLIYMREGCIILKVPWSKEGGMGDGEMGRWPLGWEAGDKLGESELCSGAAWLQRVSWAWRAACKAGLCSPWLQDLNAGLWSWDPPSSSPELWKMALSICYFFFAMLPDLIA